MKEVETKEDIYNRAQNQHSTLDRRLQMLLKKPYLTVEEELESKVLKKQKLYFKDIMERAKEEMDKGET
ncbi:MAG: hypothetical protein A3K22_02355 [Deltaproteobacteria bacterium RBG_16_42_7]|nr:MAG: hypothetical protein A3K22_02355 [Deltaproteobacteria bacterium RBG_16_42_7]